MTQIDSLISWCEQALSHMSNVYFQFYALSYGVLRWLKAGMLFRINEIKIERDAELSKYSSLPVKIVQAINRKISEDENLAESGVFNSMVPRALTFESTVPASIKVQVTDSAERNALGPLLEMRFELLDEELRHRCGDLYQQFAADPTHQDRFDTVLRDASVVIETRIRGTCELPDSLIGEGLLAKALAADTGELIFSDDKNEQRAVHLLFLGFFGFVRNSVNHRLVPTYTKERAAQVLGLADYLLFLLSRGRRRKVVSTATSP